uniref:Uncharacterized protein n=1 Tax=Oryza glumipatula TaxID=40148 RepID=A0A0E0BLY0_9ORYZ
MSQMGFCVLHRSTGRTSWDRTGFASVLGATYLLPVARKAEKNTHLSKVAFGVTKNWTRVFDCFGGETLVIDMGSSYLKTCMFVFVLGINKDTIFIIYD